MEAILRRAAGWTYEGELTIHLRLTISWAAQRVSDFGLQQLGFGLEQLRAFGRHQNNCQHFIRPGEHHEDKASKAL